MRLERLALADGERAVEPALEADRRNRVAAQPAAAHRPRVRAEEDGDVVGQRAQPLRALEQVPRAPLGRGRQFGPAHVTHHQGVPGERGPRLAAACAVHHDEGEVLGGVPGRVQDVQRNVAQLEFVPVQRLAVVERGAGARTEHALRAQPLGETPGAGQMVGVDVRVDHVPHRHAVVGRRADVNVNLVQRIDHGGDAHAAAPHQVGRGDRLGVQELAQDHDGPTATGCPSARQSGKPVASRRAR